MTDHVLQGGMLKAFEKAKCYRIASLVCALILVLLPFGINQVATLEFSLFILFVLRGLQFFLNYLSRGWASLGRKWHQFNLFLSGLGEAPSASVHQEIVHALGVLQPINTEEPYFASVELVGPVRLVENVSESAFYTSSYASFFKNVLLSIEVILGLIIFYVLSSGFGVIDHQTGLKILITLAGFFLFGDLANRILELHRIEKTCSRIADEGIRDLEKDRSSITVIKSKEFTFKYILALSNSIPLPTWVHKIKRERVEKAWLAGIKKLSNY
jgi:hypothetical protein